MTDPSEHPEAQAIFAEYGIEVVPANVMPGNGQTRAIATLDRIRNRHGEAHARFVVMTLSETANNKAFIDETSLWVISDMVRAAAKNYPSVIPIIDVRDDAVVLDSLGRTGGAPVGVDLGLRRRLAAKVFEATSRYDAIISAHFSEDR